MPSLITTLGDLGAEQLGLILPHEHIFVDLGPIEEENWRSARSADVIPVMQPQLAHARAAGVSALVECTPVGVGRRADIVRDVSLAARFPVVIPTGIYREPWVPAWAHKASEAELTEWMVGELTHQIEDTGVKAGWIKLSAGDNGLTAVETKILRAAAVAGSYTNALIGSHTIRGSVVRDQLNVIEDAGYSPERFVWIHTQAEPDFKLHLEMAERGCWLEYDAIGSDSFDDAWHIEHIQRVLDAGFGNHLLLSQDRGWYDPSKPGSAPLPFTYLSGALTPKLAAAGIESSTLWQLTHVNPFKAFSR